MTGCDKATGVKLSRLSEGTLTKSSPRDGVRVSVPNSACWKPWPRATIGRNVHNHDNAGRPGWSSALDARRDCACGCARKAAGSPRAGLRIWLSDAPRTPGVQVISVPGLLAGMSGGWLGTSERYRAANEQRPKRLSR